MYELALLLAGAVLGATGFAVWLMYGADEHDADVFKLIQEKQRLREAEK